MIDTVQGFADEANVSPGLMRAYLTTWRKRGDARLTGKTVRRNESGPGPKNIKLHEVRDGWWRRFLTRADPAPDILRLSSRDYKREAAYRYYRRTAYTKRVYLRLRRESFARRYPFVVLE